MKPVVYYIAKIALRISKFYFKLTYSAQIPMRQNSTFILAANHVSALDPFILGAVFYSQRNISFMATRGLFRPPLGWFLKSIGTIPVDRKKSSHKEVLNTAIETLQNQPVLIFPSGGRSTTQVKAGLGFLAIKSNLPVYPVFIVGTEKALPKGKFIPRPKKIHVEIGSPILPEEWLQNQLQKDSQDLYLEFSQMVMSEIKKMREKVN
jgi:1-acyl-sn-glycerol-3-phosphate acyltransferase